MPAVTVYAQSSANWDAANNWDTVAGGGGTDYTNPQDGADQFTCDLNGFNIVMNLDISVTKIRTGGTTPGGTVQVPSGATRSLTVAEAATGLYSNYAGTMLTWAAASGTLTVYGDVTYASTFTAGMLAVSAGQTLVVNGQVTNTNTGYAVKANTTGILTISNAGGVAISNTGNGLCLHLNGGSGACTITGNVEISDGDGAILDSTSVSKSFSGNIVNTSTTGGDNAVSNGTGTLAWTPGSGTTVSVVGSGQGMVNISSGILNILGNLSTSWASANYGDNGPIWFQGGTLNWTGDRTLADGTECFIRQTGGTINFATASARLNLANSGTFVYQKMGGTFNTADAGAGAAVIANQNSTSYAAMLNVTAANRSIITNPAGGDYPTTWKLQPA